MNGSRVQARPQEVEIPQELQRSIPRDVELTGLGRFAVVGGLVLVITALALSVATVIWSKQDRAFRQRIAEEGRITSGTVLSSSATSGKNAQRMVSYEFEVNGATYRGRTRMRLRGTEPFPAGSPVQIGYLAGQPGTNWIVGHPLEGLPVPLFIIEIIGSFIGAYAIYWHLGKQRSLLADGRAVIARVTRVEQARKGDKRVQRVSYEFTLMSGAKREGHFDLNRNAPQVNSTLTVLYDRDNESRQARYPMRLYRIVR